MKPKLFEFMSTEIPDIDFKIIENVIKAYWKYESSTRGSYCDICLTELSNEDKYSIKPDDFLYTCKKHREHSNKFQVDLVRKELGIQIANEEYFQ